MYNTKLDKLGRIVIPVSLRRELELGVGCPLEVYAEGGRIVIRRPSTCCRLCYATIDGGSDSLLCESCIEKIKNLS
ncbi:MAG: AbrB/MazE/SpoVT family DNA-binding domain-containing protein [Clostridia bacterium]|nr:AbrB/MazE/SpoVT family DNA-binding domain-containing protein [Clostridia bacterium]